LNGTELGTNIDGGAMNIVCLSHLRWNFVFQRPQHLLSRAARQGRVLFIEEPLKSADGPPVTVTEQQGVLVCVPRLPANATEREPIRMLRSVVSAAVRAHMPHPYVLWLYTPMALPFSHQLRPAATVYDCMDELSAFAGAPKNLRRRESELFQKADVVFTGGQSLYEAKRFRHPNVHAFPSSVDAAHFERARATNHDPMDQRGIPRPRIGFFGVIDERMDYDLLRGLASARKAWQFVLVGPTAKIEPANLPRAANIHYLGAKSYAELPAYIAGWDVAMLPFARNEATRFISPTKTPEYLAAGKPVVSTSIRDVVRPYGYQGLARIANTVSDFAGAVEAALVEDPIERLRAADAFLTHLSWDGTWTRMKQLIEQAMERRRDRPVNEAMSAS
jgi:glycosyltransferase involved in cell wall biosynthesis